MTYLTLRDGTQLYYKDWGTGQPVVFSHGWPLSSDAWEDQMLFLAAHGYRCIAHDRRGGEARAERAPGSLQRCPARVALHSEGSRQLRPIGVLRRSGTEQSDVAQLT
jgi:pimeloyl-ACP methyl ester carboxylesterase